MDNYSGNYVARENDPIDLPIGEIVGNSKATCKCGASFSRLKYDGEKLQRFDMCEKCEEISAATAFEVQHKLVDEFNNSIDHLSFLLGAESARLALISIGKYHYLDFYLDDKKIYSASCGSNVENGMRVFQASLVYNGLLKMKETHAKFNK